jgi:hypothetical protein
MTLRGKSGGNDTSQSSGSARSRQRPTPRPFHSRSSLTVLPHFVNLPDPWPSKRSVSGAPSYTVYLATSILAWNGTA